MRRKPPYFERSKDSPAPVTVTLRRRVQFSEVDALAIVWHGRYAGYFEEASSELGRRCGFGYEEMREHCLAAPIVQFHADHHRPLQLSEEFSIQASWIWNEGARIDIEYQINDADGNLACSGYTVQTFVDLSTRKPLWLSPPLLDECRARWRNGDFYARA